MRNISFFILLSLFSLTACDEDPLAMEAMTPLADFDFELTMQACFAEKSLIILDIEASEKYSFLWEINGSKGGHEQSPSICYCGTEATVSVTRMEDGLRKKKSINLPACESIGQEEL